MKYDGKYLAFKAKKINMRYYFSLVMVLAIIDQIFKYKIRQMLGPGEFMPLLPFFSLWHVCNSGVAFSFLSSFHKNSLIFLTCSIILLVLGFLWNTDPEKKPIWVGCSLVLGGAFGNLIDRIYFAYVMDYFLFHGQNWSFAVFNLADVFITCGSLSIFIGGIRKQKDLVKTG